MKSKLVSSRKKAQHKQLFRNQLQLETLEPRCLLANDLAELGLVSAKLAGRMTGATIITHGFQLGPDDATPSSNGDALMPLAQAIRSRANGAAPATNPGAFLVDYELSGEGGFAGVDLAQSILPADATSTKGELVLLFDWSFESNEASPGWASAAGDALFSTLVQLGVVDPESQSALPLHFIRSQLRRGCYDGSDRTARAFRYRCRSCNAA